MRVAICITTYKRKDLLRELLQGIAQLNFRKEPVPQIEIIVVDNDPAKTAEEICRAAKPPWPIKYISEPCRGISQARNRAVQEAGTTDFIAFLDDDEVPTPVWLEELISVQDRFHADVVAGPVVPRFEPCAAEWIKTSGLFERPSFPTGQPLDMCSTANVLIRREVFFTVPSFDPHFGLSGGEDTHFFLRVRKAGHSVVWSQEAVVLESVPAERARFSWIVRRGYQGGNSWSMCELSLEGGLRVRVLRFLKASAYIVKGVAGAFPRLFLGKAALARSLRTVSVGVGMLTGLTGFKFLAYQIAGTRTIARPTEISEPTKG
jgi:succinoglycan biosynthesis protein ExoM